MMPSKIAYTIAAVATGGRDGHSKTEDGAIDVKLATPKELGGSGDGKNPEQLFAAGYAACYLGAMKFAASQDDTLIKVPDDATVRAAVGMGPRDDQGFGLKVDLEVTIPGADPADVEKLAAAGHKICPYSHATQGNITVTTTVS